MTNMTQRPEAMPEYDYEYYAKLEQKNDVDSLGEQTRNFDFASVDLLKRLGFLRQLEGMTKPEKEEDDDTPDPLESLHEVSNFLLKIPGSEAQALRAKVAAVTAIFEEEI